MLPMLGEKEGFGNESETRLHETDDLNLLASRRTLRQREPQHSRAISSGVRKLMMPPPPRCQSRDDAFIPWSESLRGGWEEATYLPAFRRNEDWLDAERDNLSTTLEAAGLVDQRVKKGGPDQGSSYMPGVRKDSTGWTRTVLAPVVWLVQMTAAV
ncbi:hypothetical protein PG997_008645 [Apiospora hydei]|uniref:Uncharacterized protein n=1 Tax=Apiospora hydei TaxID=1337664 RepID=A0ABR1WCU4_9PEZI